MELYVLLMFFVQGIVASYDIEGIDGVTEAKERAITWLKSQRDINCGWQDTVRAVTALMLVEENFDQYEKELYTKELELAISLERRNPDQTIESLALSINALLSTCRDPRNFYNNDLVNAVTKNQKYIDSVISLMALCNANWDRTITRILYDKLRSDVSEPSEIDEKALIYVALRCCTKREGSYQLHDVFEKLQNEDGGFGNVYRTALILQAYLSSGVFNEKVESAITYLIENQAEDGSFGNIMTTYLAVPVLAGKTLANITDIPCEDFVCKAKPVAGQTYAISVKRSRKLTFKLWIREDKYINRSITLDVATDTPVIVFDVMKIAAAQDEGFSFEYTGKAGKEEVYSIGGWNNDPELGYYWHCYLLASSGGIHQVKVQNQLPSGVDVACWYKSRR